MVYLLSKLRRNDTIDRQWKCHMVHLMSWLSQVIVTSKDGHFHWLVIIERIQITSWKLSTCVCDVCLYYFVTWHASNLYFTVLFSFDLQIETIERKCLALFAKDYRYSVSMMIVCWIVLSLKIMKRPHFACPAKLRCIDWTRSRFTPQLQLLVLRPPGMIRKKPRTVSATNRALARIEKRPVQKI